VTKRGLLREAFFIADQKTLTLTLTLSQRERGLISMLFRT
jgi:hypothetical protein